MKDFIIIKGAREHNLKNLDLRIPRNSAVVITGPSGSGKSSLAIDTIYAEGQRRYVKSLSSYARQFIQELRKPELDYIEGLSPSVAIQQKTVSRSPRSTLGTITEIYDYMRVLYTRVGRPFCYKCGSPITVQDTDHILLSVLDLPEGTRLQILAPLVRERKGEYRKELQQMRREGFIRARIDGEMVELTEDLKLRRHSRHTIEIVIDRLIVKPAVEKQLRLALEAALVYADTVVINLIDSGEDILFSKTLSCLKCGVSYQEITPMFFSFNSRLGACPSCRGLGYEGITEEAEDTEGMRPCSACNGLRLNREALSVTMGGLNIGEFSSLSLRGASDFINGLRLSEREHEIAGRVLKEVGSRLGFLIKVGLGYLTLDRPASTLSGGEAQRVRLATQLGASLTGVLYVLDEPSIGLHPRDCRRLLDTLTAIKDAENTVIIVEHDEETIRWADHVVDLGPGGGRAGGWVVAEGTPGEIQHNRRSLTGEYLSKRRSIPVPASRRKAGSFLRVSGISEHNLKNITVDIPLGIFTCVTGVSGSGKSSLVMDVLYRALLGAVHGLDVSPGRYRQLSGVEKVTRVISVEQKPLGKTPRSNPATYTGVFNHIRDLFSRVREARIRGYTPGRFSFNLRGGRCETCRGEGCRKVEMHFLPDVYVPCDDCGGKRYNRETLQVRYRDRSIADVLEMTLSEAYDFFSGIPAIRGRLQILMDVGLGYVRLGQSATTLSGGEAQRVRLAKELGRQSGGNTLYILDEPTTGLHFVDIERLLHVIYELVKRDNTVVVIEHNLDVIKSADYIIDLGPEGGDEGGYVVAAGTPEEVAAEDGSYTGSFLRERLNGSAAGIEPGQGEQV
ncbi:UvrABC system protein A [bacterium BMS3Bbin06]|nr:UvrABC system protein A [bacterium BMS3Abin08]GBE35710.1 UvrABC system protein A [bacterium BMS3Bbin06]HDO36964.1 excinuclease ABC subunit A [Nitrospirota bacterium]HDY70101.1 excinuclease ABC subunit A [Nitrospirota bacterium]